MIALDRQDNQNDEAEFLETLRHLDRESVHYVESAAELEASNCDLLIKLKNKEDIQKLEYYLTEDGCADEKIISFETFVLPEEAASSRTGRKSASQELCQDRKLVVDVRVVETPISRYRGDIDGLEKAISKEYRRRLFSETPKYFFTHEHMEYLMDQKFFPGKAKICMQNLELCGKPLLDLIREEFPDVYEYHYAMCPETSLLYFPILLNEQILFYKDRTGKQDDQGPFVIRFQEYVITIKNKLFIQSNDLKSTLFCMSSAYIFLETPKPRGLFKTLSFLEQLFLRGHMSSRNKATAVIRNLLEFCKGS